MNSKRILTRKTLGLDHRVLWSMTLLLVVTTGLFSYTLLDKPACIPLDFKIKTIDNDSVYSAGEILSFSSLRFEKNITWNFGDNSTEGTGTFVTHRFATEGKYYIRVTVNSDCQFIKPITVRVAAPEDADKFKEKIIANSSTSVGVTENFTSLLIGKSYEWKVENHPEYNTQSGQTAMFRFRERGDYTIQLTIDGDRFKSYRKSITVVENEKTVVAPPKEDKIDRLIDIEKYVAPEKSNIFISEQTFAEYLGKVISGNFGAKDFNDFLCNEGNTPVIINGKADKQLTFVQACAELNGRKEKGWFVGKRKLVKIKTVRLNRDQEKCITLIEIKYD